MIRAGIFLLATSPRLIVCCALTIGTLAAALVIWGER